MTAKRPETSIVRFGMRESFRPWRGVVRCHRRRAVGSTARTRLVDAVAAPPEASSNALWSPVACAACAANGDEIIPFTRVARAMRLLRPFRTL